MRKLTLISKLLFVCCLWTVSTQVYALDIPRDCSDLEMLQEKWETRYFHELKFDGYVKTGIPRIKCDSLLYKFVKAVWAIENLKTSPEFGNIYEQLKTHVKEFRIMPYIGIDGSTLCANTTPEIGRIALYLCAFSETEKKESYPWGQKYYIRNLFRLISTISHELRHLQIPEFQHVDCPNNGPTDGCDVEFSTDLNISTPYVFEILYIRDILKNNRFLKNDYDLIFSYTDKLLRTSFSNPVSK